MNYCQFRNDVIKRMANAGGGGLPAEYQQVEYLWSPYPGSTYIKTGFVPNQRFKTVVRVQYRSQVGLVACGSWNGTSGNVQQTSYGVFSGSQSRNYYYYQNPRSDFSGYDAVNFAPYVNSEDVTLTEDWITPLYKAEKSDATYTSTPNDYFPTFNNNEFFLFARNQRGDPLNRGSIKIYWAKFYDSSNTLVRDYIPCYRKSDNKPGMYDLVNNTFNVSANSYEFTLGNNV